MMGTTNSAPNLDKDFKVDSMGHWPAHSSHLHSIFYFVHAVDSEIRAPTEVLADLLKASFLDHTPLSTR
jgi:hypothetical protein